MKVHPRGNHVLVKVSPEPARKIIVVSQPNQPSLIRGLVMELGPFANHEMIFHEEPDAEFKVDVDSETEATKQRMKEAVKKDRLHVGDEVLFPLEMEQIRAQHLTIDKEDWYLVQSGLIIGVVEHEEMDNG